ncbi:hypothetical protein F4779DRAFT_619804 [Xylariaceae sp. FL0662B]|nr:hypothetical protein F4779DRAFT_619804 [Xylariaceae sp. FL0662B]
MKPLLALFCVQGLIQGSSALGPGGGTIITFHPNGCGNNDDLLQLANPGNTATSPPCIFNEFPYPHNTPAGGWQIANMPAGVSFEVRQGPRDGEVCGPELILQVANDGCYELDQLADRVWWNFCNTGVNCDEPPTLLRKQSAKRSIAPRNTTGLQSDAEGEYMMALTGERIPVYRQQDLSPARAFGEAGLSKRQTTTFNPPVTCFLPVATCQGFGNINDIEADCVNCVMGLGNGNRASRDIDCRNSKTDCAITFMSSVTVTDTVSVDISFGASIGFTGQIEGSATFGFGVGFSFSTATTKGQSLGLNVPAGHIGFAQYQPPAVLGSVISTPGGTNDGIREGQIQLCSTATGFDGNLICQEATGILATSGSDNAGQYSVVLTS